MSFKPALVGASAALFAMGLYNGVKSYNNVSDALALAQTPAYTMSTGVNQAQKEVFQRIQTMSTNPQTINDQTLRAEIANEVYAYHRLESMQTDYRYATQKQIDQKKVDAKSKGIAALLDLTIAAGLGLAALTRKDN